MVTGLFSVNTGVGGGDSCGARISRHERIMSSCSATEAMHLDDSKPLAVTRLAVALRILAREDKDARRGSPIPVEHYGQSTARDNPAVSKQVSQHAVVITC